MTENIAVRLRLLLGRIDTTLNFFSQKVSFPEQFESPNQSALDVQLFCSSDV